MSFVSPFDEAAGVSDPDDPRVADIYDDLPLWSAPFGLALLDTARLRPGLRALDVGCGAGFPIVELAERLGPTGRAVGVDPWRHALVRLARKIALRGAVNACAVEGVAEALPFTGGAFDLAVSNNGFNNVADAARALAECARVLRRGGQLVLTFNLPKSMLELYGALGEVLRERGLLEAVERMREHIASKRQPVELWLDRVAGAGFRVERVERRQFTMRYADSAALFGQWFMRLAFVPSWLEVVEPERRDEVFAEVRARLDQGAAGGGFVLTIPFACVDCTRA
jgi:SAM-dependent methyltransferase